MDVFMCDCCKRLKPKGHAHTIKMPYAPDREVCPGCNERVAGFIRSITLPFPEPAPPEAP